MYGALANRGALASGERLTSAEIVASVEAQWADPARLVPTRGKEASARLASGFSPWVDARIHAAPEAAPTLGHNGMGGAIAFADPRSGAAVLRLPPTSQPACGKRCSLRWWKCLGADCGDEVCVRALLADRRVCESGRGRAGRYGAACARARSSRRRWQGQRDGGHLVGGMGMCLCAVCTELRATYSACPHREPLISLKTRAPCCVHVTTVP